MECVDCNCDVICKESEKRKLSDSLHSESIYTIGEVYAESIGHDDYNIHILYNYIVFVD